MHHLFLVLIFLLFHALSYIQQTQAGALHFTKSPSGVVYYPPPQHPGKTILCKTNQAARIMWVNSKYGVLDDNKFNITKESDKTSILYLTAEFVEKTPETAGFLIAGHLWCSAGGKNSSSFNFKKGEMPSVNIDPVNVTVTENEEAHFSCGYQDTWPSPTSFKWKFLDKQGTLTILDRTHLPKDRHSGLHIASATRSDAGVYACVIENEFGKSASSWVSLTVKYFESVTLAVQPSNVVEQGTHVTIDCVVDAVPASVDIQLSHGDTPIIRDQTGTITLSPNHLTYTIIAADNWTGQLTCSAANSIGSDRHTVNLTVQVPPAAPIVNLDGTVPSTYSMRYSWILGDDGHSPITDINIMCYDTTLQAPYSYSTTNVYSSAAVLVGLIPGSTYYCSLIASNKVGESTPSDNFNITTLSAAPLKPVIDPKPMSSNETSLTIHWSVSHNGGWPITHYVLRWRTAASTDSMKTTNIQVQSDDGLVNQFEGTWVLNNLVKGVKYFVKIEAVNRLGSNTSDIAEYTTACYPAALSHPQTETQVGAASRTIKILADIPSDNGCGVITNYILRDSTNGRIVPSSFAIENGLVTITVTGLEDDRKYNIYVYTENQYGAEKQGEAPVMFQTNTSQDMMMATGPSMANSDGGGLGSAVIAVIVVVAVVILPVIAIVTVWLYKKHKSKQEDASLDGPLGLPGKFKQSTSQKIGYDETDTKGPNSGSTYVHLGPNNRRTDRKPSLTSIHFGDRAERYSSSTPRGAKSPGFDCENKSTSQLPQAYMTMHSPLSDTTSKSALIASIKQLERASPDGSHNPPVQDRKMSQSTGYDDETPVYSSPTSSNVYAPRAVELALALGSRFQTDTYQYQNIRSLIEDPLQRAHLDLQPFESKTGSGGQHSSVSEGYVVMKPTSDGISFETVESSDAENSEAECDTEKHLSTLV